MSSASLEVQPLLLEDHPVYGGIPFPLILECRDSTATLAQAVEWAHQWKDDLIEQAFTHGTVLFRNFPIDSVQDFDQFLPESDVVGTPGDQVPVDGCRALPLPAC